MSEERNLYGYPVRTVAPSDDRGLEASVRVVISLGQEILTALEAGRWAQAVGYRHAFAVASTQMRQALATLDCATCDVEESPHDSR